MLSAILALLENSSFRKALLILVAVAALSTGGVFLYKHIYDKGYDAGVTYQTTVFTKEQDQAKALLAKEQKQADSDRATLNQQIENLKSQNSTLQTQLDAKYTKQAEEVTNYATTTDGTQSCFSSDSDGLRIINESFPNSN